MRVNVSSLCFVLMSHAHEKSPGPRDSQSYWQDRPGGSDGSTQRDEELYVKASQAIGINVPHTVILPVCRILTEKGISELYHCQEII